MAWVGRNAWATHEQGFNLRDGYPVLLTLGLIAVIPVKPASRQIHHSIALYKCIYIAFVSYQRIGKM